MATTEYRIVSAEESTVHDEPHVEGSRLTVRHIHAQVESRGLDPAAVAERYDLDVSDVYEALAYYHRNPEEMDAVDARRERLSERAEELTTLTPPEE